MKGKELFLEIGSEEIPAAFIKSALESMANTIRDSLEESRIAFGNVKTFATPRRLLLVVDNVSERQDDVVLETQGPAGKVAYDAEGKPTKALEGFVRSQGISIDDAEIRKTPKGEYIFAVKEEKGADTVRLLPAILGKLISSIPFRKSMRWRDLEVTFARPVHWIVSLFGGEIVPVTFGDVQSSNVSRGHRFHAPDRFEVSSFSDYNLHCKNKMIIIDPEERKSLIRKGALDAAADIDGILIEDEPLLEEIANLVEYPVVLRGNFDEEYLNLPREVVINAMREHQRYFSMEDSHGKLLPSFITVSNTRARDMGVVRKGNERVLRARLSDAAFYYYEDLKIPLDEMVESLKGVVFQTKLGTSFEKVERIKTLAVYLADEAVPEKKDQVLRAAHICKADLMSGVVGEFPSLQGIMGRDYALKAGEDKEVAEAVFEHYLPRNADDILPSTDTGAIVALADKMDTICGCFGVGLIPTGGSDPYALRRQAIGIINILLEKGYKLSLYEFISKSVEILQDRCTKDAVEISKDVAGFFRSRLSGLLTSAGYPHDVVDAVLSAGFDDIVDAVEIVKALSPLKDLPDFEPLAVSFKRIVNITKGYEPATVDPSLFEVEAEEALHHAYHEIAGDVFDLANAGKYGDALLKTKEIRLHVDKFFDDVMVMVDDEVLKNNRLSLLKEVSKLFIRFADFSKIVIENK